jgi:CheY-like chemotaxis protein/glycine cleavage system H lipoate-binding protein
MGLEGRTSILRSSKLENKAKVLVVDDEIPVCKSVSSALDQEMYTVDMALSGEEALKKEAENRYDVIIADLMMPGMSGMDLLRAVKDSRPDLPLIMITGYPSIKTAVQAVKLGAFDYMPKPFTPSELRNLVSRALKRKKLYEEEIPPEEEPEEGEITEASVPKNLYCIPEHSWAKVEDDGSVRVGLHDVFLMTVKALSSIEFPDKNKMVNQGEVCLKITDGNGNVHRLWSPVSGMVISVNSELEKDYSRAMRDPYGSGWMLLIEPMRLKEDLKNLVTLSDE